jgi:hypothetical protein
MAAQGLTGRDGSVEINGALIGKLRQWSWDEEASVVDTGGFGSQYEEPAPSRIKGTGSCTGIWARGDAAGQGAVETTLATGTSVNLTLAVSQVAGESYVVPAFVTKIHRGAKYDGEAEFSFDWSQNGAPTTIATHA